MTAEIPRYEITDNLHESQQTLVHRGRRSESGAPVILKILKSGVATAGEVTRFRREFELTARAQVPGVIGAEELGECHGNLMMVLEDIGGESLDRRYGDSPMPLAEFWRFAVWLAGTLAGLHQLRIIHQDINPAHVVHDPATGRFRLIDFGLAEQVPAPASEMPASEMPASEMPASAGRTVPPVAPEGALAYMSPERTGRLNRVVDHRADLYSVGATFYHLLTGKPPFDASDPLGMIHNHLARVPVAPQVIEPGIPLPTSRIILKLLAKTPEDRYQSGQGLKADLERCRREWARTGDVRDFELGADDLPDRPRAPRALYGRRTELDRLTRAVDQAADGGHGVVLVTGPAGVGKTALVQQIRATVQARGGFLVEGKFEDVNREPYSGWTRAMRKLVNRVLTEDPDSLDRWRRDILEAVHGAAKVLTDVIPNLEPAIGPQPAVAGLEGAQTRNRFHHVFREFVKAAAATEHPLVIFLDDLQWADAASLELLRTVGTGDDLKSLLLIGAYRSTETGPGHPLTAALGDLAAAGSRAERLDLSPLTVDEVHTWLSESLACPPSDSRALAGLAHARTGGNPFFLAQFLGALYRENLLTLDAEQATWRWDIEVIRAHGHTDDLVEFLVTKMDALRPAAQDLLRSAACLGQEWTPHLLGVISARAEPEVAADLAEAVAEGFVVPAGDGYRFVHDRVREAAYRLLPADRRQVTHLQIGRNLLADTPLEALAGRAFEIAHQLDQAVDLLTDPAERATLRHIDQLAGERAKAAAAYTEARDFLARAVALLPEDTWAREYGQTFSLLLELAECESLVGNFTRADELFEALSQSARSRQDRARVCLLRTKAYQACGRFPDALRAALDGLAQYGVTFPESDEEIQAATEREFAEIHRRHEHRPIGDLLNTPVADDEETRAVASLLGASMTPAYVAHPALGPLIVATAMNLFARKGHTGESCHAYICHGVDVIELLADIPAGFAFSEVGLHLTERPDNTRHRGRTLMAHGALINSWARPLRTSLDILERAATACVETGDLAHAGNAATHLPWILLETGAPLAEVMASLDRALALARETHNDAAHHTLRLIRLLVERLVEREGVPESDHRLLDQVEEDSRSALERAGYGTGIGIYHITKTVEAFIFRRYCEALEYAARAESTRLSVKGMIQEVFRVTCHALTLTAILPDADPAARRSYDRDLRTLLGKLRLWAENCPENFLSQYLLVQAEIARVEERDLDALRGYEEAIRTARENGFLQYEAIARELAAAFHLGRGRSDAARLYLLAAYDGYSRWGARAKARALAEEHPDWLAPRTAPDREAVPGALDLDTVLKATHAISGEIEMDRLLTEVMRTVIENAGARRGFLLLDRDGKWVIAASEGVDGPQPDAAAPIGIEDSDLLSPGVVRFVARTRERVILDDAAAHGPFVGDPQIRRERIRSLLCTPLLSRGLLVGVIYLENDLMVGAFTPRRVELLEMILAQAAIALENAGVHSALKENETKYRRIVDTANEGVWVLGPDTSTRSVNAQMAQMLGYRPEDMVGRFVTEFMFEEDRADHELRMEKRRRGVSEHYERRFRRRDGVTVWTLASATPILASDGHFQGSFAMFTDITERRKVEQALADGEERFRLAFDDSLVGMALLSVESEPRFQYLRVNRAMCEFLGHREKDLLGLRQADVLSPEAVPATETALESLLSGELTSYRAERSFRRVDRTPVWGRLGATLVRDAEGAPLYMLYQVEDITVRKHAERQLVHRALHDDLTGLPNRALLMEHLANALARARRTGSPLGVMFLDLDDFKSVNDSFGHTAGDEFLSKVAVRISANVRASDIAARVGGDEFVIICENLNEPADADVIAAQIQRALAKEIPLQGQPITAPVSIGIALSQEGSSPESLLRDADAAMYIAKKHGGRRWEPSDESPHTAAIRVLSVEAELRRAMERHELLVHYQPLIDLATDRIIAVEALLRWQHPTRGLVLPGDFIDVAEHRGLITEIGAWVLHTSCGHAAGWYQRYGDAAPHLAVNVSTRQLGNRGMAAHVYDTLDACGLPTDRLYLEVTESQLLLAGTSAVTDLRALAERGIRIAVDDFGTGFAGFDYLRRLPLAELKIDKSFIDGIGIDRTRTAITASIVALGHGLDLTIVAEGIETPQQLHALRDMGCSWGQGWLWHPAMPAEDIDTLLRRPPPGFRE